MVGKLRMSLVPPRNHWWHVTLYVSAHGLTTGPMPYDGLTAEVELDFVDHRLHVRTSEGREAVFPLHDPTPCARFYAELRGALHELGVDVALDPRPFDLGDGPSFPDDTLHASYDADAVHRFWTSLVSAHRVLSAFRGDFRGKGSPVHFFWGAFDLAVTRFSGRPAPRHPGGVPNCPDRVMVEAYSEEVSSCGYWPGGAAEGVFYAYAYPEPPGYRRHPVQPDSAVFDEALGEFVLPYADVRRAADTDDHLLRFLTSAHAAAVTTAGWPEQVT
jgi:hypothetical protein